MAEKTILVVVEPSRITKQPVSARPRGSRSRAGAALELFAVDYDVDIDAGRVSKVWIPESGLRERRLLEHRQTLDALAEPLRASRPEGHRGRGVGLPAWRGDR